MEETTEQAMGNEETEIEAKIGAAVAKQVQKLETQYQEKLIEAKKDAQRLEKLSEDERAKEELAMARKELEVKEKALRRKEIELETSRVLEQRSLPIDFLDYFIAEDNEETLRRIKSFEKSYKAAIEKAVNERLKSKAPASSNPIDSHKVNRLSEIIKKNQISR